MRIYLSLLLAFSIFATPSMANAIMATESQKEVKLEKVSIHPRKFGDFISTQNVCIKAEEKSGKYVIVTTYDEKKNVTAHYLLTGTNVYTLPETVISGDRSALSWLTLSDPPASRLRKPADACKKTDTQVLENIRKITNNFRGDFATGFNRATIHTEFGDIVVSLDAHATPYAVTNFLELIKAGYYKDQSFTSSKTDVMVAGGEALANAPEGSKTTIYGTPTFEEKEQCLKLKKTEANMTENKNTYVGKWSVLATTDKSSCVVRSGIRIFMENTVVPERDVVIMGTVVSGHTALKKLTQANISPSNPKSFKKFSIQILK